MLAKSPNFIKKQKTKEKEKNQNTKKANEPREAGGDERQPRGWGAQSHVSSLEACILNVSQCTHLQVF